MNISPEESTENKGHIFRLFVAGDEPNSRAAKNNIRKFCEIHIDEPCQVEVVDVLVSFKIALENNIFLTPALKVISAAPPVTIFGDLTDTEELIKALRLGGN